MDIESLHTFIEVEKCRSFTHASDKLYCTQAAISSRIKKLEESLGCSLFERRAKSIVLTQRGELFLPYAKQMYNIWTSSREHLTQVKLMEESELQLACAGSLGTYIVPSLIYLFRQKYPYVSVVNNVRYTRNVVTAVAESRVHLGIISQTNHVRTDEKYICEPLIEDPLIIVTNPTHPWTQLEGVHLCQLADETLLLPGTSSSLVNTLERLGSFSLSPDKLVTDGNIETIKRELYKGCGVTVLSEYAVRPELELGVLRRVPILDSKRPTKQIYSLRKRGAVQPLIVKKFLEFAAEAPLNGTISTRCI